MLRLYGTSPRMISVVQLVALYHSPMHTSINPDHHAQPQPISLAVYMAGQVEIAQL